MFLLHLTPVHIIAIAAWISEIWRSLSFEPDHFRVDEISTNFDRILLSVSNHANCLSLSVTLISTYWIALRQILLDDLYATEMPPSIRQLQGKVQNTAKDVLQSWRKLQEVVEKNEGTRQRIWNNKTRLVRENILRSA